MKLILWLICVACIVGIANNCGWWILIPLCLSAALLFGDPKTREGIYTPGGGGG